MRSTTIELERTKKELLTVRESGRVEAPAAEAPDTPQGTLCGVAYRLPARLARVREEIAALRSSEGDAEALASALEREASLEREIEEASQ